MGLSKGVLRAIGAVAVISILLIIAFSWMNSNTDKSRGGGAATAVIEINYTGPWSGSVYAGPDHKPVSGIGPKVVTVDEWPVSATIQKQDDSSRTLSVNISEGNRTIQSGSTSAGYGSVSLTAMP
jgi:hypothetical protein